MGKNQRFHHPKEYYITHSNNLLEKAVENGTINADDKGIISEFIEELSATTQISPTRRYKLVGSIIWNRKYHPALKESCITDVYKAIESIKSAKNKYGKQISKNTISDQVRILKRVFVWMVENEYSTIDMKKLQKIKVPGYNRSTITAEELLSEDEINKIIECCNNSRDRALISTLYEGGFRIGEIANLTWGDIEFNGSNATARTSEKTGKERFVPLFSSCGYLAQWKNDYPLQITPESLVFLTTTTKIPLQYNGLVRQIRALTARAGITKHIKPHLFRHSRITHLCQKGLSESAIKLMMWGDVTTNMLRTYLHLTKDDLTSQVAELNGIELPSRNDKNKGKAFKPLQCPNCASFNPPTAKYCLICGEPLTEEGRDKTEKVKEYVRRLMQMSPTFTQEVFMKMGEKEQNIDDTDEIRSKKR